MDTFEAAIEQYLNTQGEGDGSLRRLGLWLRRLYQDATERKAAAEAMGVELTKQTEEASKERERYRDARRKFDSLMTSFSAEGFASLTQQVKESDKVLGGLVEHVEHTRKAVENLASPGGLENLSQKLDSVGTKVEGLASKETLATVLQHIKTGLETLEMMSKSTDPSALSKEVGKTNATLNSLQSFISRSVENGLKSVESLSSAADLASLSEAVKKTSEGIASLANAKDLASLSERVQSGHDKLDGLPKAVDLANLSRDMKAARERLEKLTAAVDMRSLERGIQKLTLCSARHRKTVTRAIQALPTLGAIQEVREAIQGLPTLDNLDELTRAVEGLPDVADFHEAVVARIQASLGDNIQRAGQAWAGNTIEAKINEARDVDEMKASLAHTRRHMTKLSRKMVSTNDIRGIRHQFDDRVVPKLNEIKIDVRTNASGLATTLGSLPTKAEVMPKLDEIKVEVQNQASGLATTLGNLVTKAKMIPKLEEVKAEVQTNTVGLAKTLESLPTKAQVQGMMSRIGESIKDPIERGFQGILNGDRVKSFENLNKLQPLITESKTRHEHLVARLQAIQGRPPPTADDLKRILEADYNDRKGSLQQLMMDTVGGEIEKLRTQQDTFLAMLERKDGEIKLLNDQLQDLRSKRGQEAFRSQERIDELKTRLAEGFGRQDAYDEIKDTLKQDIDTLVSMQANETSLTEILNARENQVEHLKLDLTAERQESQRLRDEASELREDFDRVWKQANDIQTTNEALLATVDRLRSQRNELRQQVGGRNSRH
ncbi:Fc.00g009810.m01.CDS01 [Cosmosporella sp. VM-42]